MVHVVIVNIMDAGSASIIVYSFNELINDNLTIRRRLYGVVAKASTIIISDYAKGELIKACSKMMSIHSQPTAKAQAD